MKIYLGADHGGFKLKEEIKKWLAANNFEYEDLGAHSVVADDDYPDYAYPVAKKVAASSESFGILACRSGQGECIVANKVTGVRGALAWNTRTAFSARNDDNANILCLPADYLTSETALAMVKTFLQTKFSPEERFTRRLNKVNQIDHQLN